MSTIKSTLWSLWEFYEPETYTSKHHGIARYLRKMVYEHYIVHDYPFKTSREVIYVKKKQAKAAGKGNKEM